MDAFDKTEILRALIKILEDVREGWDWSSEVIEDTGIFSELGFEAVDARNGSHARPSRHHRLLSVRFAGVSDRSSRVVSTTLLRNHLVDGQSSWHACRELELCRASASAAHRRVCNPWLDDVAMAPTV